MIKCKFNSKLIIYKYFNFKVSLFMMFTIIYNLYKILKMVFKILLNYNLEGSLFTSIFFHKLVWAMRFPSHFTTEVTSNSLPSPFQIYSIDIPLTFHKHSIFAHFWEGRTWPRRFLKKMTRAGPVSRILAHSGMSKLMKWNVKKSIVECRFDKSGMMFWQKWKC